MSSFFAGRSPRFGLPKASLLSALLVAGAIACDRDHGSAGGTEHSGTLAKPQEGEQHALAERDRRAKEAERLVAEEQAKKTEAEAQKQAKDKVLSCCDALAKVGFEQRSMTFMKAFEACDVAFRQDKSLGEFVADVSAAVAPQPLPSQCQAGETQGAVDSTLLK